MPLTASRARIVATADETRRRIERDLHDGVQQRLVNLGLQLRSVQADMPPELGKLRISLDRVAAGLTNAAKHAQASAVHIAIEQAGAVISVSIHDDGTGGADPVRGTGLVGLRDRVTAIGGCSACGAAPGRAG